MTKLEKIKKDIANLSPEEIWKLADWFAAHHADLWDKQIAKDAASGRLDVFADQATTDHVAGKTTPP